MDFKTIRTCKFKIGDKVTLKTGQGLFDEAAKLVLGTGTIKHIRPAGENNLCLIDFPVDTEYIEILDTKLLFADETQEDIPTTILEKNTTKTKTVSKTKENDTILSSVETVEKKVDDTPKPEAKYNVGQFVMFTPKGVKHFKESFGLSIGSLCKKLTIKNISYALDTYKYEVVEFPSKSIPENLIAPLSNDDVKAHLQILSLMSEARIA